MSAFLPKTDVYRTSSQGGVFGFNSEFFAYEPVPPVRGEKRLEIRPSPFPSVATPQRAAMIGERVRVEASAGPIQYLAIMTGTEPETRVRWLIRLMVLCLDPAAIALTVAATARDERAQQRQT
jgi:hypothetical protein